MGNSCHIMKLEDAVNPNMIVSYQKKKYLSHWSQISKNKIPHINIKSTGKDKKELNVVSLQCPNLKKHFACLETIIIKNCILQQNIINSLFTLDHLKTLSCQSIIFNGHIPNIITQMKNLRCLISTDGIIHTSYNQIKLPSIVAMMTQVNIVFWTYSDQTRLIYNNYCMIVGHNTDLIPDNIENLTITTHDIPSHSNYYTKYDDLPKKLKYLKIVNLQQPIMDLPSTLETLELVYVTIDVTDKRPYDVNFTDDLIPRTEIKIPPKCKLFVNGHLVEANDIF